MRKYTTILDISRTASYQNINARLIYLHIACRLDCSTYDYTKSIRQLASELNMTVAAVRSALKLLQSDGLVTTRLTTHRATHFATHVQTQLTTQLHLVRTNELEDGENTPNATPNDTPADTPANTPADTQKNNINNKTTEKALHTHDARAMSDILENSAVNILEVGVKDAATLVEKFYQRQELKAKTWANEGDVIAHFISWSEKHLPKQQPTRTRMRTDTQARQEERERAAEEAAAASQEESAREELERLRRWQKNYIQEGRLDLAAGLDSPINVAMLKLKKARK